MKKVLDIKDRNCGGMIVVRHWFFFKRTYYRVFLLDGPEWKTGAKFTSASMWFFLEGTINTHRAKYGLPDEQA